MSSITIKEVKSRKALRKFIYLPSKVHMDNEYWLPPLYSDEWILHDPEKNKAFEYCDYIYLLAYKDSKPAGRIMGIINKRYNELRNEKNGRFCFLESFNDNEIVHKLLTTIENWAKEKGMDKIVGPIAFSDKDPQGIQIEGFEYMPVLAGPVNKAYLGGMIEAKGYDKEVDLVDYMADIPDKLPEVFNRVIRRLDSRSDVKLLEFRTKKDLKPYILDVLQVMNDAYTHIYGFVPLSEKEKKELARRYMPILDPRFIKAVSVNGKVISFVIAMPNIAEGLRKAKGKLFPFGFIHILRSGKKSSNLQFLLGAVLEEYRGQGFDALMGVKIIESATISKMKTFDSHLVLENNKRMRRDFERIGGKVVKRYRIFQKQL